MTADHATTQKPLKDKHTKSFAYIKMCEKGQKGAVFKDFETQVEAYLEECPNKETRTNLFKYTFVELVVLEVMLKNSEKNIPFWNFNMRLDYRLILEKARCASRYLWHATTKYHAFVYRGVINDTMIRKKLNPTFKY